MHEYFCKLMAGITLGAVLLQTAACGTLLYPERRGQKSGEIDIKIAVLDGIGLFFFIVPGVVAYVVDFTTGGIYLPPGKHNTVFLDDQPAGMIRVPREQLRSAETIRDIVSKEMGLPSTIDWSKVKASPVTADQAVPLLVASSATGFTR